MKNNKRPIHWPSVIITIWYFNRYLNVFNLGGLTYKQFVIKHPVDTIDWIIPIVLILLSIIVIDFYYDR